MTSIYRNRFISEQVAAVHSGAASASELAAEVRTDIIRYEEKLKAWVAFTDLETELADPAATPPATMARPGDPNPGDLPLSGISVGVKDIIDVAGLPTRSGSPVTPDTTAQTDAACVTRLRELGATIQGKTVTTEFGYFSPGPTVNPWNHGRTPGGSSSGSAAAVGANSIPLALGTQTAGSLTRPASFCGVAGMVLAADSTPMAGISGMSETLDSLGLLTRNVTDLDYVYSAFTDQEFHPDPVLADTTLHLWEGSDLLPLAPQMSALLAELPRLAVDLGLTYSPLDWSDHVHTLVEDHRLIMGYEATRTLAEIRAKHESELSPQLRELLQSGAEIAEADYQEALIRRTISRRALERLLGDTGVILGPAAAGPAPESSAGTGSPDLSRPWQLLGMSVVIVPGAKTTTGLPLGVQLIGLPGSEKQLLHLGRCLESRLRRIPSLSESTSHPTLKDLTW
ncbi:amidase [Corynebacterium sp. A21]|uniref:amidase n=1 Tax=Corynebacterium sp. A21 TaxID=3457318 RepID=UPI003FD4337F